jgi:hypothetical protein
MIKGLLKIALSPVKAVLDTTPNHKQEIGLSNVKDKNNKIDLTKLTQKQIDKCLDLVNIYKLELTPIIFNQNSFVIICDYLVRKLWFDTLKYFLNKHIKLYQYTITKEKYIDACNLLLNTNRIFELMYLMQLCENYKIDLTQKQYDVIVSYLIARISIQLISKRKFFK